MTGRARGKEVALQVEVESQEEWEELISKEGLTVIDVYQEWCGPCKAMVSNFKRLKNEIGDDLLRFAVAKADSIEALERYRGKCEPCFLFYAGGLLVDVIHGANSPLLQKKMISQLAHEHKVLEGLAERKEVQDPNFPHRDDRHRAKAVTATGEEESEDESSDEDEDETRVYLERMFTIGIIKPDVYAEGKTDEIIERIREAGFDVLEQMERVFAQSEIKALYHDMKDEPDFHEVVKDMCSGTSVILVLSKGQFGEGIIQEWKEFLGPENIGDAKVQAPKSLRAIYCDSPNITSGGFHASNSLEASKRELNLFFPDFVVPKISMTHIGTEMKPMTIAIIRPAALQDFKDEILAKIKAEKFKIEFRKEMQMTKQDAEEFYKDQSEEPYYEELVTHMASGPMLVLALSCDENVVETWRSRLGSKDVEQAAVLEPESYRGKFTVRGVNINLFHGSDSMEKAKAEFNYFFPIEQTVAAIKPHAYHEKDAIIYKISQAGFKIVARKEIDLTEEKINAMYRNCTTKEFFGGLTSSLLQGPTTFLILSKPNAVAAWRAMVGATNPELARTEQPKSFRALFGKDVLRNAVHASSNISSAKEEIALIFGDLEFDAEGMLKKKKRKRRRSSVDELEHEQEPAPSKSVSRSGESARSGEDDATGPRLSGQDLEDKVVPNDDTENQNMHNNSEEQKDHEEHEDNNEHNETDELHANTKGQRESEGSAEDEGHRE